MSKLRVHKHAVTQPSDESIRLIPLSQGQNAIVDTADFEWLNQWNWFVTARGKVLYACRRVESNGHQRSIYMHSVIAGKNCDHRNRDGLDNRRNNLRKATVSQQGANHGLQSNNTSGFKGVSWFKSSRKWKAQIQQGGVRRHLAYCHSKEEAARIYDSAAREAFGEFALLNFPQNANEKEDLCQ